MFEKYRVLVRQF